MSRGKLLFFGSCIVIGCGGQVIGADGGPTGGGDSSPPTASSTTPPPQMCGPMSGSGSVSSNGDCTVTEKWTCGATSYQVDCTCPQGTCDCSQFSGNTGGGTQVAYGACPSCTQTGSQLAKLCGFPSN